MLDEIFCDLINEVNKTSKVLASLIGRFEAYIVTDEIKREELRKDFNEFRAQINAHLYVDKALDNAKSPYYTAIRDLDEEDEGEIDCWPTIEQRLRHYIRCEIEEVDALYQKACGTNMSMQSYWDGMRVGYANVRIWLDKHGRGD
jgi:hypothetical protein